MPKTDSENITDLYAKLKADREKYVPLWQTVSEYVGIKVDPNYTDNKKSGNESAQLDLNIDDPTAAVSVQQAGDYLQGLMWGTGNNAMTLAPTNYVIEKEGGVEGLSEYFDWATETLLEQMNYSEAGFHTAQKPYYYDQTSFGTSGIGVFPNPAYKEGTEEHLFIFKDYGIDNVVIDEGRNGLIDTIGVTYHWRVNRIIEEFAFSKGIFDEKEFAKLPKPIRDAYEDNDVNQKFTLVEMIYPRKNYRPSLKGKRGTKYIGEWFVAGETEIFATDDYKTIPIAMARAMRVRGEVWGRGSGTILISTIRSTDYMVGKAIEIVEKQAAPPLGMWGNATIGDEVLDTSAEGLTAFNAALLEGKTNPVFPLHDVGDPSNIMQFLVPYLNEKIATAFKIDVLLDFNSSAKRTATEIITRDNIRSKSVAGIAQQQKIELYDVVIHRCISIAMTEDALGIDPADDKNMAEKFAESGIGERIIPAGVLQAIKDGKRWYKIRYNNELDRMVRVKKIEGLMQVLQGVLACAQMYPDIIHAVKWYKWLEEYNENVDVSQNLLISAAEFKVKIEAIAQQQAMQQKLEQVETLSKMGKNMSGLQQGGADEND